MMRFLFILFFALIAAYFTSRFTNWVFSKIAKKSTGLFLSMLTQILLFLLIGSRLVGVRPVWLFYIPAVFIWYLWDNHKAKKSTPLNRLFDTTWTEVKKRDKKDA